MVRAVTPDSPADAAGIRPGDVLISLAGRRLPDPDAFHSALRTVPAGDAVTLVLRRGQERVEVTLRSRVFPAELAALVKHMIVSHHGAREFGSPEPPKTIEAVLLNYIDEIDSRMNSIREFMDAADPSARWTSYHRLLERHFFIGDPPTTGV